MGKITCKKIALGVAGLLLPCSLAIAAGLGKITVLSALGQPLRAEIEVVAPQPGEADSLSARLASADAFRRANVELNSALLSVRFALQRREGGNYVIAVTSSEPLNEPFVDMLVELSSPDGRLVREYTFLLDPQEYKGPVTTTPAQAVAPPEVKPLPAEVPPAAAAPAPVEEKPLAAPPKVAGTYEVIRGDTLAKIAQSNAIEGVTLQQMLVALFRANEEIGRAHV